MGAIDTKVREAYPLPASIAKYHGQIGDIDGHEHIPINLWEQEFGPASNRLRDALLQQASYGAGMRATEDAPVFYQDHITEDDTPISPETVFRVKLEQAPGGISLSRRDEVLDYIGIKNQIIFPGSMALTAVVLHAHADEPDVIPGVTGSGEERRAYALEMIASYNDWIQRSTSQHARYTFVGVLLHNTFEGLLAETKLMLSKGVRAFWTPSAFLIGGMSPAHVDLDPFWALLAENNTPFATHICKETSFLKTMEWGNAPAFEGWKMGEEFKLDPWTLSTLHLSTQNLVTTLVMGGVFERHPTLRFSAAEVGAYWLGPLGEIMDLWHANSRKFMQTGGASVLSMKPSEYLRRNVRVAPYDIEDVGGYIQRYGLEECYCFASDLPHLEGGKHPVEDFERSLAPLGHEVLRKFFVENAKLIFPD